MKGNIALLLVSILGVIIGSGICQVIAPTTLNPRKVLPSTAPQIVPPVPSIELVKGVGPSGRELVQSSGSTSTNQPLMMGMFDNRQNLRPGSVAEKMIRKKAALTVANSVSTSTTKAVEKRMTAPRKSSLGEIKKSITENTVDMNAVAQLTNRVSTNYPYTSNVQWRKCDGFESSAKAEIYSLRAGTLPLMPGQNIDVAMVSSIDIPLQSATIKTDILLNGKPTIRYTNDVCSNMISGECPIAKNAPIALMIRKKAPRLLYNGVYTIKNTLYNGRIAIYCAQFDINVTN